MAVPKKTEPSEMQIALDNRAFEIQLFWQRSNYFMVLMTALGIGVFSIKDLKYSLMISIFASITSWFWYRTNLGSKFWHESWEVEVVNLAKEQGIRAFERPTPDVIKQVKQSLEDASSLGDRGVVRRWLDRQILKKPSVSHYMILLSLTSTALWGAVSLAQVYDLAQSHHIFHPGTQKPAPQMATPDPAKQTQQTAKPGLISNGQKEQAGTPSALPLRQ